VYNDLFDSIYNAITCILIAQAAVQHCINPAALRRVPAKVKRAGGSLFSQSRLLRGSAAGYADRWAAEYSAHHLRLSYDGTRHSR